MVFKVKQKARTNYFSTQVGRSEGIIASVIAGQTSGITYNWPYDFFSLVELVKLDAEVDFSEPTKDEDDPKPKTKKTTKKKRPNSFKRKVKENPVPTAKGGSAKGKKTSRSAKSKRK